MKEYIMELIQYKRINLIALCNVQDLWNFLFVLFIASFELPNITIDVQRNIGSSMHSLCRRAKIVFHFLL
jgi:hypothetical protein